MKCMLIYIILTYMSKYRKSSLSPCWSALATANKENFNLENIVSFKNIVNNKKQHSKRQDLSPHNVDGFCTIYTNACRQLDYEETASGIISKGSRWRVETRESGIPAQIGSEEESVTSSKTAKNDLQFKDILKSKDKQINSLLSQVKVLQNTIDLLKSQVDSLAREARTHQQQGRGDPKSDMERLTRENLTLKKELREYEQIVPKLNELQIIQNSLIEENKEMKAREQKMRTALREVKGMLGGESGKIGQLLGNLLN